MIFHGVEIKLKPGESPVRARERILKEQHAALQQAITSGEQDLNIQTRPANIMPKVVGMAHTPITQR